ncbi:HD domain-containing protein [Thiospirochaeta perfilievii]|uniref:HD domain-containing protein n=1 Tax=Thiospirochaeta perfilievii TaxID=252967 RepID=A0A5C1Q8D0_9SPIO|nr:HD domain-containing phosphohydrolase [Thiospirochaeta perfilievii]QEN04305.1 HD domain-containing protein [Thiospirochaeta perfilievii]
MNYKWAKYIIMILFIVISTFFYIVASNKMKIVNQEVLITSKCENDLTEVLTDIESLYEYQDYLPNEIFFEKINGIYAHMAAAEIDHYNDLRKKDFEDLRLEVSRLKDETSKSKKSLISTVSKLKKERDNTLFLTVIIIVLIVFIEFISYTRFSSDITKYLKKIEVKDYDFKIRRSSLPFSSDIYSKIDYLRLNLKAIDEAISGTLKGYGIKETLSEIFTNINFKRYISFDRIGFATINKDRIIASFSFSDNKEIHFKQGFNILLEESSLSKIKSKTDLRIINDLDQYFLEKPHSMSTELLIKDGYKSSLTAPITDPNGNIAGFLFFSSRKKNNYVENDKYKVLSISDILSSIFSKNMLIDDLVSNAALGFVKLVEDKDPETGSHLERMQKYSRIIAMDMLNKGIYPNEIDINKVEDIYKYAPLHDIGKVGIPDKVLLKPGRLTPEEMDVMKRHSEIGSRVLILFEKNLRRYEHNFFSSAINISLCHHEKWDGTGYPNSLKGVLIPIEARVVSVADVFDALCSKRVYKEAFPFEKGVEIVTSLSGTSFDPKVVESFLDCLDDIRSVYNDLKEI